ncbi:uncharacterized protein LOC117181415 [Belonocnema kinseyi]|uniref:uncharacterized protein LOC117181415 n=1 Tax=Belonocnema kinseyi TaxID=2817044 RepID=UPI00143D88AA|nr:uncharacterized protein LOC117181415 [Belonocnema kinseyi]
MDQQENNKKFKQLLRKVKSYIEKERCIRQPIPARTRLEICLRYLASGDSMTSISFVFRVSPNTVSKIVWETCKAIWLALRSDAHYRFIAVDIGALGRRSDGWVFRESRIGRRFERNTLHVPPPSTIDEKGTKLPYVLVGDIAFSLSSFLMRPYPRSGVLNRQKKNFNY